MAVRQYIGARYVAKIYVNSLDPSSADWESGVAYEPLTMVTYNSSSYISRKAVTTSIGNPADNPEYWAVTGLYNGQIAQLQNDVNAIEAALNNNLVLCAQLSYSAEPDGVKTISDLLDELATQFKNHVDNTSGRIWRYTQATIGAPKFGALFNSYRSCECMQVSTYGSVTVVESGEIKLSGSDLYQSINGTVTDLSNTVATSTYYLYVDEYMEISL